MASPCVRGIPDNWRFPFYTVMLDRFVNGDPLNDNMNGTVFEQDAAGTQLRFGGDISGLVDSLDYIQGMGIKGLYIAGTPFINQPWGYDAYSPLDNTLLDMHFGNITEWRAAMDEIHRRGMYVVMDNTMATMGDLIGFDDYRNSSAPFESKEIPVLYKTDRQYHDWGFTSQYNETCEHFPRLYLEDGTEVGQDVYGMFSGCYDGEFDQFGDTEAFGNIPDYQRQLTKFSSVQDRLREWVPSVNQKLAHFSCILIKMLDIDGFRYDKALQVTVDAQGNFSKSIRECASSVGKENFFQPGEVTLGNTMGAVYVGRGRHPKQWLKDLDMVGNLTNTTTLDIFIRDPAHQALDSVAFHYSLYRYLVIFLGINGVGPEAFDVPSNFVEAWNEILLSNDLINANTGKTDPRHMYGTANQDTFRWPAVNLGRERNVLGFFISTLHLPGIPLLLWGEEQAFYTLDNTASNYMYGRQPISSAPAWQRHECYSLPELVYHQMPLEPARRACRDDTVSWDHRDPSHPMRNILKHMYYLREKFLVLQDGLLLEQLSNHTEDVLHPGNAGAATTTGLFSVLRYKLDAQDFGTNVGPVWLLYSNRNTSWEYSFNCSHAESALISPFKSGMLVKNLMFPHQEMALEDSPKSLGYAGQIGVHGCVSNITMRAFEFRAYVPTVNFVNPPIMLTKFKPGHDYRIESIASSDTISIEIQVSATMNCVGFKDTISFRSITNDNSTPSIDEKSIECKEIAEAVADWSGAIPSAWSWKANLTNVKHGVHQVIVTNATTHDGKSRTQSVDRFLLRVGAKDNPIVFPQTAEYSTTLLHRTDAGAMKLLHTAAGATKFRYSTNWESSWSSWKDYETETTIEEQHWTGTNTQRWQGKHVVVQYFSKLLGTSAYKVHADLDFDTPWRIPHMFAAGPLTNVSPKPSNALLYLLPYTVPVTLSLHNAEFQGMWPMRTAEESEEVCKIFNLELSIVRKFCQYGSVFNLLNVGASYIRIHQKGLGVVGVSEKYRHRSLARYPIFWGLPSVGRLPNPDPLDSFPWDRDRFLNDTNVRVDEIYEAGRSGLKIQAQDWAGLERNPEAELFIFLGRWSIQKGVDLVADIFPWVLEHYPGTQLICIGPVVDLYGRFAALKIKKLVEMYSGRVCSKPEFTVPPHYLFSAAEFVLIPSRDEPFGLVAVEFGKSGALGVGARVGGLGQTPGWWYTVESTKTSYLIKQFQHAIRLALETDQHTRAQMRAWSVEQRFPISEWLEKLETLYSGVIQTHMKCCQRTAKPVPPLCNPNFGLQVEPVLHKVSSGAAMLSLDVVVGDRDDFNLQQTYPVFTDDRGDYYRNFEKKLANLTPENSVSELCLGKYLAKSEKEWFNRYRDVKLGRAPTLKVKYGSSSTSVNMGADDAKAGHHDSTVQMKWMCDSNASQFALPKTYVPPIGMKKYLQYRVGDWPIYAILLAANQVIASNPYQVALLVGEVDQTATRLYVVTSVYLGSSVVWFTLSRVLPLFYLLSLPYLIYGVAFMIIGCSPFLDSHTSMVWSQNVAIGLYAFASSSSFLAFAFNFGAEGGSTISIWIQRLAFVQGLAQLYSIGLWALGSLVSSASAKSHPSSVITSSPYLLVLCLPLACLLWALSLALYLGLPDFYRESPGPIPQLWKTLLKRKTIMWYLFTAIIQNYFLSTLAGRNWFYLFSSEVVPIWGILMLALALFAIWGLFLTILANASKNHPWLFPIFAVGLGAPRWAQIWWGTSRIGLWMPWAGSAVASVILSRILWLWLGILDSLQAAGIGMMLLLTLTRVHVAAACVAAQIVGSITVILARATSPNKLGPGDTFPDISEGVVISLSKMWFWIVLGLQLLPCIGYFKFFRKEQVDKP